MKPFAAVLLTLDLITVALFSLGGIAFHSLSGELWNEFWRIALPFFIGLPIGMWAASSYDEVPNVSLLYRRSAVGLAVGLLNSFLLRGMQQGEVPAVQFLIPSSLFFVFSVVLCRGCAWALMRRFS